MKTKFTLFVGLTTAMLLATSAYAAPRNGELFTTSCTFDEDCRAMPDIHPVCSHYCTGNECDRAARCYVGHQVENGPLPDCVVNNPCKRPSRIWCEKGECKASS